jgi:hypothetical protein
MKYVILGAARQGKYARTVITRPKQSPDLRGDCFGLRPRNDMLVTKGDFDKPHERTFHQRSHPDLVLYSWSYWTLWISVAISLCAI